MDNTNKTKHTRNKSFDIAKGIAFFGLSIVTFVLVFRGGHMIDKEVFVFLHGKFASTLIFLLGAAYFLMVKKYVRYGSNSKIKKIRRTVLFRSIFFLVIGYLLFLFWPYDMLHFYAIFMLFSIPVMAANKTVLWSIAILLVAGFAVVFPAIEFPANWLGLITNTAHLFAPAFTIKELLFFGQYSLLPYGAFFLIGIWYADLPLTKLETHKLLLRIALPIFIAVETGSYILHYYIDSLNLGQMEWLVGLYTSTNATPPLPLFVLSALAFAISLVSACYLLKEKFVDNIFLSIMERSGRMLFSMLFLQSVVGVLGMGMIEQEETKSITFVLSFISLFVVLALLFVLFWNKKYHRGPVEKILRLTTGYKKKDKKK